jgi:hypothetical protein
LGGFDPTDKTNAPHGFVHDAGFPPELWEPNATSRIGVSAVAHGVFYMTNKATNADDAKKPVKDAHPGMMGDGTEEQNLNQRGNPEVRIKKKEIDDAFGKKGP